MGQVAASLKLKTLNDNPYLESMDTEEVHKEFLTQDELKRLAETPCRFDVLKNVPLCFPA